MNTGNIHYAHMKLKLLCQIIIQAQLRNTHGHHQKERHDYLHPYHKQCLNTFIVVYLNLKLSLVQDYPNSPIHDTKLINLINHDHRKNRPKIFSVYDLKNWCDQHKDGTQLNSTYVPFYTIENIFILFTTKQLFQQIKSTTYLQVDATYKITWNEPLLLGFGSTDANRHFKPFGIAFVSHDENETCYEQLFTSISSLATQQFNQLCLIGHVMIDAALGNLVF